MRDSFYFLGGGCLGSRLRIGSGFDHFSFPLEKRCDHVRSFHYFLLSFLMGGCGFLYFIIFIESLASLAHAA